MSSYAITAGHLPIASGAAPLPAADALEDITIPSVDRIATTIHKEMLG
jgi:hypothetical protein